MEVKTNTHHSVTNCVCDKISVICNNYAHKISSFATTVRREEQNLFITFSLCMNRFSEGGVRELSYREKSE